MTRGRLTTMEQVAAIWRGGTLFFGYDIDSWKKFALFGALFSLMLAIVISALDPTHTSGLPFWKAVILWTLHVAVAINLMTLVVVLSVLMGAPSTMANLLSVLCLPLLLAPVSLVLDWSLGVEDYDDDRPANLVGQYVSELLNIAPSSMALAALVFLFVARAAQLSQVLKIQLARLAQTEPTLREVLPDVPHRLGDDLIRLEVQDHYVLAVTTDGTTMMNAALADCVAKLKDFNGSQCHRSHWIRHKHVTRLAKLGSAYKAVLSNGEEVPVSRRRYGELRRRI